MQLTKNFNLSELDCKSGADTPAAVLANLKKLANNLQVLRDTTGKAISINSGYRSPEHNKAIGGASASQHMLGTAADIVVEGMTPAEVFAKIEELQAQGKMAIGGLHAYPTFTHYDIRGTKARW
jgi:uncharacterized protein YcbK (DUF882 family)